MLAGNAGSELERRAAHGLAIRAVTNPYQIGVDKRLPGDVATKAGTVNLHGQGAQALEHFVGEELEHHWVLHAQQHAADFAALASLFPGTESLDDALGWPNE